MDFSQVFIDAGQTVVSRMIFEYYHRLGLTADELVFWLELSSYQQAGNNFPDPDLIARRMGISQAGVFDLLQRVIAKGCLQIVTQQDEQGRQSDRYDFSPLYGKLALLIEENRKQAKENSKEDQISRLYQLFEQEFGRPLSPLEFEKIAGWLEEDHYDPELIRLALKEAVTHQARSLNYIDRILLSWESKKITTKEEVLSEQSRRKLALLQKEAEAPDTNKKAAGLPPITLHNPFKED